MPYANFLGQNLNEKFKRNVKKFKTLKKRVDDLKGSEAARAHKELMIDSQDTVEIIEDLLIELKDSDSEAGKGAVEDISYYLSQLEENVHELERSQSLAV